MRIVTWRVGLVAVLVTAGACGGSGDGAQAALPAPAGSTVCGALARAIDADPSTALAQRGRVDATVVAEHRRALQTMATASELSDIEEQALLDLADSLDRTGPEGPATAWDDRLWADFFIQRATPDVLGALATIERRCDRTTD